MPVLYENKPEWVLQKWDGASSVFDKRQSRGKGVCGKLMD